MTPQERQLVAELFDRLASLERGPRDPDAERAIAEGFGRAPNAAYALVQTVLVQDEALKRANARIEELQATGETPREGGGFLDSMRGALLGRDAPAGRDASPWRDAGRGSVPSVRPGGLGTSGVWGPTTGASPTGGQPMTGPSTMDPSPMSPSPMGVGTTGFGGGSFLGTAAASAAGVIGGAMMLNGIRSMFGHSPSGASGASALDTGAAGSAPWGGSAANSDLARQAGIDHIGGDKSGATDPGERHAGLLDTDDQNDHDNDGGLGDDTDVAGDFDGGDTDSA